MSAIPEVHEEEKVSPIFVRVFIFILSITIALSSFPSARMANSFPVIKKILEFNNYLLDKNYFYYFTSQNRFINLYADWPMFTNTSWVKGLIAQITYEDKSILNLIVSEIEKNKNNSREFNAFFVHLPKYKDKTKLKSIAFWVARKKSGKDNQVKNVKLIEKWSYISLPGEEKKVWPDKELLNESIQYEKNL